MFSKTLYTVCVIPKCGEDVRVADVWQISVYFHLVCSLREELHVPLPSSQVDNRGCFKHDTSLGSGHRPTLVSDVSIIDLFLSIFCPGPFAFATAYDGWVMGSPLYY